MSYDKFRTALNLYLVLIKDLLLTILLINYMSGDYRCIFDMYDVVSLLRDNVYLHTPNHEGS